MDFSKYKGKISNSGGDEYGGIKGGKAGDQTGGEWNIRSWYNRPWTCVLRYPDAKVRELIAELAIEAAENNKIGYDQNQRQTYWNELKKVGYHPKNITVACEADCSAGVIANTKAAGALLGIPKLVNITATYTGNMRSAYVAAGFQVLTASKYLTSQDYLMPGDILLNDTHHTATNLGTGKNAEEKKEEKPKSDGRLNGIDVSSHKADIDTEKIEADFIIPKATQGTGYINPYFEKQINGTINSGKIPGIYHYANGSGIRGEVNFFLQTIEKYIGKAFLCLDWETSEDSSGRNYEYRNPEYAKAFMDEVRRRTGLTMFLYGSKACFREMDWSAVKAAGYPIWGANYKDYNRIDGYQEIPWQSDKDWGPWGAYPHIHQYTSMLYLPGYGRNLDGNLAYMTAKALRGYTIAGTVSDVVVQPNASENLDKATLLELVARTMEDEYGKNLDRKKALGDRYEEVQAFVDYIYKASTDQLVTDTCTGKFGNDPLRKRVLHHRYEEVRAGVNAKLKGMKSVEEVAKEIVYTKPNPWGNDPERTKKLRAAGYDSVAVQNEVNRLLGYKAA